MISGIVDISQLCSNKPSAHELNSPLIQADGVNGWQPENDSRQAVLMISDATEDHHDHIPKGRESDQPIQMIPYIPQKCPLMIFIIPFVKYSPFDKRIKHQINNSI